MIKSNLEKKNGLFPFILFGEEKWQISEMPALNIWLGPVRVHRKYIKNLALGEILVRQDNALHDVRPGEAGV